MLVAGELVRGKAERNFASRSGMYCQTAGQAEMMVSAWGLVWELGWIEEHGERFDSAIVREK